MSIHYQETKQKTTILADLVCLGYVLQFHRRVAELGLLEQSFAILAYASFLLHCLLYVSLGRLNAELKYRYIVNVLLLCFSFQLRLRAIWARLTDEGKLSAHFSEFRLKRHLNYIAEVLHFLADFNRLYGRMLWATLLVVYPDNATKWIVLLNSTFSGRRQHQQLLQTMSPLIRFALLQDALIVLLFAKLVHYKAARLTWPLYGCARYATRVAVRSGNVRGGGRLGPRARLKLERYIALFHSTERPHTVTFGRHGNVTMSSFGTVSFLFTVSLLAINAVIFFFFSFFLPVTICLH